MSTRLSLLALACAGALAACSAPRSPVDPSGNAWVTQPPASAPKPTDPRRNYGAFGGGALPKPAAAPASRAAPAR
ncbi:MAG: hypothetical protein R3E52_01010 [Burkholderiaceae bacterium]